MSVAAVPSLCAGIDLTKVTMSVEEAFVASRVDGRVGVQEIATLIGKDAGETRRILMRLAQLGVIRFGEDGAVGSSAPPSAKPSAPPAPAPGASGGNEYTGFVFPPGLMQEEGDLDEETRKRIIWTHEHVADWTHYELLQAARKADSAEIKKAYFLRSKEWHPDRFRKPNLGSFKRMIETIYKQINEAYRILSDVEQRKAYDDSQIFEFDPDELETLISQQREQEKDRKLKDKIKERRRRSNPVRKRIARARKFYEEAQQAEAQGKLIEALRLAQMAATYDDKPQEYQKLAKRLKDSASEFRIEPYLKRGGHFESMTQWDDAIDMFEEAVRLAPNSGRARLRLAYNLLFGGRDAQVALGHAQRAAAVLPNEPEAHFILGRLYEKAGMDKLAKRAYEQALELRPEYQDVKKRLKRLKWGL